MDRDRDAVSCEAQIDFDEISTFDAPPQRPQGVLGLKASGTTVPDDEHATPMHLGNRYKWWGAGGGTPAS
ncbi:MAG: hypothetical protein RQM90_02700 [Methanoculleus sp.]